MHTDPSERRETAPGTEDIARLQEKLAFYESFDQLIQTNVSQAGQLLREAIELRDSAAHDADSARAGIEDERNRERDRYRAVFATMLDEITALQGQAERLARRVTDALDQLEAELPHGAEFPTLPGALPPAFNETSALPEAGEPAESYELPSPTVDDTLAAEPEEPAALEAGRARPAARETVAVHEPTPPQVEPEAPVADATMLDTIDGVHTPGGEIEAPPEAAAAEPAGSPQTESRELILLVHGVPRAAMALSLKRYLEELDQVRAVEPREFAAGVLRLQVHLDRELTAGDLAPWAEGAQLSTLYSRPGLLELRLAH